MLLKYFYDPHLAQASYMVGCQETGEALVIDPARDITPYLDAAKSAGLRITQVTETHIHADFVSGVRELAAATGAKMYLSDMGDEHWKYAFADANTVLLHDGDSWMLGNVRLEAIHTPGHTPEHLIFQLTDTRAADRPMGLFTGDCLFVGNVGRPDLLEEAAGFVGTKEIGARGQFANVQRLKSMPDYLQIWPGHGAGSACGKGLGAVPSSTLGYEKLFNPAFQINDEAAFVRWLLEDQPESPRYFGQMKCINKLGPALLSELIEPQCIADQAELKRLVESYLVIDARPVKAYADGHLLGTVNIPGTSQKFSTYAGWYVNYDQPTYLIADETDIPELLNELRAIGVDDIPAYFPSSVVEAGGTQLRYVDTDEAQAMLKGQNAYLLDVRGRTEYAESRIPGAHNIPMGYVPNHLPELPRDVPLIVQCGSGIRSQVVASLLEKHGFTNVVNLKGGIDAWKKSGLPVE